jgi:hypothetical protein
VRSPLTDFPELAESPTLERFANDLRDEPGLERDSIALEALAYTELMLDRPDVARELFARFDAFVGDEATEEQLATYPIFSRVREVRAALTRSPESARELLENWAARTGEMLEHNLRISLR